MSPPALSWSVWEVGDNPCEWKHGAHLACCHEIKPQRRGHWFVTHGVCNRVGHVAVISEMIVFQKRRHERGRKRPRVSPKLGRIQSSIALSARVLGCVQ